METTARRGTARPTGGRLGDRTAFLRGSERERALRHLVAALDAFMWQADPATLRINFVTRSVVGLLGHPVSRWLGGPERWGSLIDPEDRERVLDCLRACATEGADGEVEFRAQTAAGDERWLRHVVRVVTSPDCEPELWGVTSDVTGEKRAAAELRSTHERVRALSAQAEEFRQRALHDALSGLPNRVLLHDRLGVALRASERSGEPSAVLVLDLDHFKEINDTEGHQAGDEVIRHVALRLRLGLRRSDTAARMGGDEFAAVLPGADEEAAIRAARRFLDALEPGPEIGGKPIEVGASIGIAVYPRDAADPTTLLARADEAMYRAKEDGGGFAVSSPGQDTRPRGGSSARRDNARRPASIRWSQHILLGVVASLMLASAGATLVARVGGARFDAAARIDAAAAALRATPADGAAVDAVVDGVEEALGRISWRELSRRDLLSALDRLQRTLDGVQAQVPDAVRERIQRLIATIRSAEIVAKLGSSSPSPDGRPSNGGATTHRPDTHGPAVVPTQKPGDVPAPAPRRQSTHRPSPGSGRLTAGPLTAETGAAPPPAGGRWNPRE